MNQAAAPDESVQPAAQSGDGPLAPQDFWQELYPPLTFGECCGSVDRYVAALPDGRQLPLPIRVAAGGQHALASVIVNQASFAVLDALAESVAAKLAPFAPEVVVGLPTLGLTLAAVVAQKMGHNRYVPLGMSRKFWYREELSVPLSSITTPDQPKRLYIDPRMLPLLDGRRVALIDDVISSGASMEAAIRLMETCGVTPAVLGAAMLQSDRWKARLGADWQGRTVGAFATPLLIRAGEDGWIAAS